MGRDVQTVFLIWENLAYVLVKVDTFSSVWRGPITFISNTESHRFLVSSREEAAVLFESLGVSESESSSENAFEAGASLRSFSPGDALPFFSRL